MVQDAAGRELMATLAKLNSRVSTTVLQYVGLFRPAKSDLNNGRALKLLKETLELTQNRELLIAACEATIRNFHSKKHQGQTVKPLTNHNYLKQVLNTLKDEFSTVKPTVNQVKQQEQEQQSKLAKQKAQADWEAQMERFGVDVNQLNVNKG